MKYQVLFLSEKTMKKNSRQSSAGVMIVALRVKVYGYTSMIYKPFYKGDNFIRLRLKGFHY